MTLPAKPTKVHVVAGGFPRGSAAGHDIDYARLRILTLLQEGGRATASVACDFEALEAWLPKADLLVTYVAGPHPDAQQCELIGRWLEEGGRWLALHGTSGGRAVPLADGKPGRTMLRAPHHELLGGFFLNHPPIRSFRVDVSEPEHPLMRGLPASFEVDDELYLIELTRPDETTVLLTTSSLDRDDPAPRSFGFTYDDDASLLGDDSARALGFVHEHGRGAVAYFALGHCHTPTTNIQPFVDVSVDAKRETPLHFRGPWESEAFGRLLRNGVEWGLEARRER